MQHRISAGVEPTFEPTSSYVSKQATGAASQPAADHIGCQIDMSANIVLCIHKNKAMHTLFHAYLPSQNPGCLRTALDEQQPSLPYSP